jgi:hypothetical protein
MQDRYAADSGDFQKLGLLRALIDRTGLRLGVNWYLVPDEAHNADGKHVAYLQPAHRRHQSLAACDPDLMARLTRVITGRRSVAALERSGALPLGSITFAKRLHPGMNARVRRNWHRDALRYLTDADVVFVDPDNGMTTRPVGSRSHKYVLTTELADYAARGQSVIVYHHADRSRGGVLAQVPRRLHELTQATRVLPLGAVVARLGSCRFFFVVPAESHRSALAAALPAYTRRWADHAEFMRHAAGP